MDRVEVMQQQWDYLVILDACRYDYFEQVYQNYLQGELTKKISIGSSTNEWRDKSFPGYYDDVVYISANPHLSADSPVYAFTAGEHFHKVYEIWRDGWDKDKGTVLPETVTNAAIDIIRNTKNKRFIIHYLQPHAPYLILGPNSRGYAEPEVSADRTLIGAEGRKRVPIIKKKLFKSLLRFFRQNNLLGNHPDWVLRKFLQIPPLNPMEASWRNAGKEGLRAAYKANLVCALEQVAALLKHLSGSIIITTDHGELLGENNCYGHPLGSVNPILVEIPWLVIEKPREQIRLEEATAEKRPTAETARPPSAADSEDRQQELILKLRALGYY